MSMICEFPLCTRHPQSNGYCISHRIYSNTPVEKKQPKPIAQKSEKRKVEDKEYKKMVKEMLDEDDRCEMKTPVCTGKAQGLHHTQKRSPNNLLNRKKCKRSCNACNLWVELNPLDAIDLKLSVSKFKNESQKN